MSNPDGMQYCKVEGRFRAFLADGTDAGSEPDFAPMAGTITFTPNITHARNTTLGAEEMYFPQAVTVELDADGDLSLNGEKGVYLLCPSEVMNPGSFNWTASFKLKLPNGKLVRSFGPYPFDVVAGGEVDLAVALPVPAATGEWALIGPAGPAGPPGAAGADGADSTVPGPMGPAGPQGERGLPGADSTVPGPPGADGMDGLDGLPGADGADGADSTVPGPPGPKGDKGDKGDPGEPGADSTVPGPQGPAGPAGADSTVPGPQGPAGPQGPPGEGGSADPEAMSYRGLWGGGPIYTRNVTFDSDTAPAGWLTNAGIAPPIVTRADAGAATTKAMSFIDIGDNGVVHTQFTHTWPNADPLVVRYEVQSQASGDLFQILVDGVIKHTDSGNPSAYEVATIAMTAGPHTIQFRYSKDWIATDGLDTAWISRVTMPDREPLDPPYSYGDVVSHTDGYWIFTGTDVASEPAEGSLHWTHLSLQGPIGPAGATGPQGPAGATGATGATGAAGSTTLAGMTDAAITSPANNQVLTYDSATSKWKNAAATGGGGGAAAVGIKLQRVNSNMATASGSRAVTYDTLVSNDAGYTYNLAAGTINIPAAGWYFLTGQVSLSLATTSTLITFKQGTTIVLRGMQSTSTVYDLPISGAAYLQPGDLLMEFFSGASNTVQGTASGTYFTVNPLNGGAQGPAGPAGPAIAHSLVFGG